MSSDLVPIITAIYEAGHHIATDAIHGADQGATNAAATITQRAMEYGYNKLALLIGKKIREENITPSETQDLGVLRDVVSASHNTTHDVKIDLLAMLAVKAAQNDTEFYTKTYVDKIEQMSPKAARCMTMFVNYPGLNVLSDYRNMLTQLPNNPESNRPENWLYNNDERRRFKTNAAAQAITPEIAYIGFSELRDLGLITGDNHQRYRLSPLGMGMIRALQIRQTS